MLTHHHLKPYLLIYLILSALLSLSSLAIIIVIIINDINGFNFISTTYLSCPIYTLYKLNLFLQIILKLAFVMTIFALIFALTQLGFLIWHFLLFKKQTQEKGENQQQQFEHLTFNKLILLFILNTLGVLSLIPVFASFLTLYKESSTCTDPTQNKSSLYSLPIAVSVISLLFQLLSFCILLKLVYHFQHKDKDDTSSKYQNGQQNFNPRQNKYKYDNKKNPRWAQRNKQMQEMEKMRLRIIQARKQMANNPSPGSQKGYLSNQTSNQRPSLGDKKLLNKYKNNFQSPQQSIYDSPGIIGYQSDSKNKFLKQRRNKNGKNKDRNTQNKYAHSPLSSESTPLNASGPNSANSNNRTNQQNANNQATQNNSNNKNGQSKKNIQNAQNNSSQASSKNNHSSSNSQKTQKSQTPQSSEQKNSKNTQMTAQQISQKQKQLMKSLPKNPYKKNISSKHIPQNVIFEQQGSQQEGSEFANKPLLSNLAQQSLNPRHQGRKELSPNYPNSNTKKQSDYPSEIGKMSSQVRLPGLSSDLSPVHGPQDTSYEFHDDQTNLNDSQTAFNQPIKLKYMNSPYLKNLKNKNITPEERRNIKRPFLKIVGNIFEFDSNNFEGTNTKSIDQTKKANKKNKKNPQKGQSNEPSQDLNLASTVSAMINLPNKPAQNSQFDPQAKQPSMQLLSSQRKVTQASMSMNSILKSIMEAKIHQQQNPILDYIQEDEVYDDKIQKIINYEKISKKRRRYIYNPFETQNKNNEKLYLHKNKTEKGQLLTQNIESTDYNPFQDEDTENANYGKMVIEEDGHGNPMLKLDRGNSKSGDNAQSQSKKNKKDSVLIDFIRSKHVMD